VGVVGVVGSLVLVVAVPEEAAAALANPAMYAATTKTECQMRASA